jgi:hypothetical protein
VTIDLVSSHTLPPNTGNLNESNILHTFAARDDFDGKPVTLRSFPCFRPDPLPHPTPHLTLDPLLTPPRTFPNNRHRPPLPAATCWPVVETGSITCAFVVCHCSWAESLSQTAVHNQQPWNQRPWNQRPWNQQSCMCGLSLTNVHYILLLPTFVLLSPPTLSRLQRTVRGAWSDLTADQAALVLSGNVFVVHHVVDPGGKKLQFRGQLRVANVAGTDGQGWVRS